MIRKEYTYQFSFLLKLEKILVLWWRILCPKRMSRNTFFNGWFHILLRPWYSNIWSQYKALIRVHLIKIPSVSNEGWLPRQWYQASAVAGHPQQLRPLPPYSDTRGLDSLLSWRILQHKNIYTYCKDVKTLENLRNYKRNWGAKVTVM